jgi:hypothetical protein
MAIGKTNAGGGRRYDFDGTALPEDVVSGKTFFSDDPMEKQTGTLPDKSGQSVAAASGDISDGQYRLLAPAAAKYSGTTRLQRPFASVADDIGLTAEKLVKGNTVLGVAGAAEAALLSDPDIWSYISATNSGTTRTLDCTAPTKRYDYVCWSFGGHIDVGSSEYFYIYRADVRRGMTSYTPKAWNYSSSGNPVTGTILFRENGGFRITMTGPWVNGGTRRNELLAALYAEMAGG